MSISDQGQFCKRTDYYSDLKSPFMEMPVLSDGKSYSQVKLKSTFLTTEPPTAFTSFLLLCHFDYPFVFVILGRKPFASYLCYSLGLSRASTLLVFVITTIPINSTCENLLWWRTGSLSIEQWIGRSGSYSLVQRGNDEPCNLNWTRVQLSKGLRSIVLTFFSSLIQKMIKPLQKHMPKCYP